MKLPRGDEYNQSVQNPHTAFKDTDLKICQYEQTPLGLPKPYSGGFTTTYHLYNHPNNDFAVRCFTRQINELENRYSAISRFLKDNKSNDYFVNAEYQHQGICVNGTFYPIIKMDWIKGEPLNAFIAKHLSEKPILEQLLKNFQDIMLELEQYKVAHGDLQHGNIIVHGTKMSLIDYDGMYLESIKDLKSNEIGHPNYQHPLRNEEHYSHRIDNFSAIIIFIALKAISFKPELWHKFDNGENLLFKAADFRSNGSTAIFDDLEHIDSLKVYVENLKKIRFFEFDKVPTLSDFVFNRFPIEKIFISKETPVSRGAYPIVDANDDIMLKRSIGQLVEIIGQVKKTVNLKDKNKKSYVMLFLGNENNGKYGLSVIYWPHVIKTIERKKMSNPNDLYKKYVSIQGIVEKHKGLIKIQIDNPLHVQEIKKEEALAKMLMEHHYATETIKKQENGTDTKKMVDLPWYLQNKDWFK